MINKKVIFQTVIFVAASSVLAFLIVQKWPEIYSGLVDVSVYTVLALALLQGVSYICRVHAWRLSLKFTDSEIETVPLHSSSAATFLVNCFVPVYIGQWLRMFILKKTTKKPPTLSQMTTAEGASLFVEAIIVFVVLIATIAFLPLGIWPVFVIGGAVFVVAFVFFFLARRHPDKKWVEVLYIFKNRLELVIFSTLLVVVIFVQPVRFYLALSAIGSPKTIIESALAFISTCIGSVLPIGPTASSTGGVKASTGVTLDLALTVGIILAASAVIAAGVYFLISGFIHARSLPDKRAIKESFSFKQF